MRTAFLFLLSVALSPLWSKDFPSITDCNKLEFEIYEEFKVPKVVNDHPMDIFAFCPTEDQWKSMVPWVRARSKCARSDYITEAWDCEDMAREWVHWTHRYAVEHITKGDPYPIATYVASVIIYDGFMGQHLKDPSYHHALGLIRMSDGVWYFYDPIMNLRVRVGQALYGEGNVTIKKICW